MRYGDCLDHEGGVVSLAGLLERGVRSVLAEPGSEAELRDLLAARDVDADTAEHIVQTLEAMPGLLRSVERSLAEPEAPPHARELFLVVLSYVLDDHNLIPSHAGRPLLGLLDDVYLIHLAALELREHLGRVDLLSVAGGAELLSHVLPSDVVAQLRQRAQAAREIVGRGSAAGR